MGCANDFISLGGVVTMTIKVEGTQIPDDVQVVSITVEKALNRIATTTISIIDGQASKGEFKESSSDIFVPGKKVVIEAGYDNKNQSVFKGIITKQSLKISNGVGSALEVECRDEAIKMIVGRKSLTFSKKKDSDIIATIIKSYSGLSATVAPTKTVWPEQVQYYVSDWDFILARAEANGFIVNSEGGKITVGKPDAETKSVGDLSYGSNLMEFSADLNAITQLDSVKASSWDFKTQKVISGDSGSLYPGPGNLSSKKLASVIDVKDYELQTTAPLQKESLTDWSKAQMVKSGYAKIRGEIRFQGSSKVSPGNYVTLKGLGSRFNGDYLVSGVVHTISEGNWVTEATLGLSPMWFTEEPDVMAPPASGLLPGAQGLFNATVKKIDGDPDDQYRVLVDIPLFDTNGDGIWARLSNFYSSSNAGAFFMPEIGDEVILGFLNEDPRYPVILGSLYSNSKNKPFKDLEPDKENSVKAIVSKSGISAKFNDKDKILTLETPGKNTAIFSDKDNKITIKDNNGNSMVMSKSGIDIKSGKNINIEASQNMVLKGTQGVKIESSPGDVVISGMNIKQSANTQFSAAGNATAELKGGAQTSIKGAMVMIN